MISSLQAADIEVEEALAWYHKISPALGESFYQEFCIAVDWIKSDPDVWHPLMPNIRSKQLTRFPYSVIYGKADDGKLLILALAHQHRKPSYWIDRLSSLS
jgi:hypothetical protein